MQRRSRRGRSALRAALAPVCTLALVATVAPTAVADRDPVPSADQVSAAQAAQSTGAAQVAALDAQLASAREAVAWTRTAATDADMASHGAQALLERATRESVRARADADRARQSAEDAVLLLSLYAAEAYQQGGGMTELDALLGADGPQALLDRAAGLEAVGSERARAAAHADAARLLADGLDRMATEAGQRRRQAAQSAAEAAAQAGVEAARALATATALANQEATLTAQLAVLQQTTADLERLRQEGLAAAEQARRDEAARQAGIQAAAEAARQAAAREAAQRDAAATAERNATSAREAAAAAAAKAAAAAAAKTAAEQAAARPTAATSRPTTPPASSTPPPSSSSKPPLNLARADMWDRIAYCESGGNWHINTGNGYYGGLQFSMQAWTDVAGQDYAPRADLASREEQITVANRLYAQRGLRPWSCRTAA